MLAAVVAASAASALPNQFRLYFEDFEGESTFPTRPEIDEFDLGGMEGIGAAPNRALTGTGVVLSLGLTNSDALRVETDPSVFGIESFGVRGYFDGMTSIPTNGTLKLGVEVESMNPPPQLVKIGAAVEINWDAFDVPTGNFLLFDDHLVLGGTNRQRVALPQDTLSAILDGASFEIQIWIDRESNDEMSATLEVASTSTLINEILGFDLPATSTFEVARAQLSPSAPIPHQATIEVDAFEIFWLFSQRFTVDSTGDGADVAPGDGNCATASDKCTLRAAIQESNTWPSPAEIALPLSPVDYALTETGSDEDAGNTGDLDIHDHVEIRGIGPSLTAVDANGLDRVFHIPLSALDPPIVRLADLTIRNGFAGTTDNRTGGGIDNHGSLRLEGVVVEGNVANFGGGIFNRGKLWLGDSVVRNNEARTLFLGARAGGIAGSAFGVLAQNSTTVIRDSAIVDNLSPSIGGAEFVSAASVQIENTTLSGNDHWQISFVHSDTTLTHVTIVGEAGLGLNVGSLGTPATVEIANSAIEGTPACQLSNNVALTKIRSGNNASSDTSCGFIAPGSIEGVPLALGPLMPIEATSGHLPLVSSPLIDAADDAHCLLPSDQAGTPRPFDGDDDGDPQCDLGAIEVPEPGRRVLWAAGILALLLASGARTRARRRPVAGISPAVSVSESCSHSTPAVGG